MMTSAYSVWSCDTRRYVKKAPCPPCRFRIRLEIEIKRGDKAIVRYTLLLRVSIKLRNQEVNNTKGYTTGGLYYVLVVLDDPQARIRMNCDIFGSVNLAPEGFKC